jgi:hypothetical protein
MNSPGTRSSRIAELVVRQSSIVLGSGVSSSLQAKKNQADIKNIARRTERFSIGKDVLTEIMLMNDFKQMNGFITAL